MFKNLLAVIICFSAMHSAHGQAEAGVIVGASEYGGDLAKTPFILSESKLGATGFFRYYIDDQISLRASLHYGQISGADANKESSENRNLSFENKVFEVAGVATYDIFDINYEKWTPYVYGGVSFFKHNPTVDFAGQTVELQPLGTEGQGIAGFGNPYRLTQFALPFGGGAKFRASNNILINVDYGMRKTFTDHLDDVSRREYVPLSVFQNVYAGDPERLALLSELAYRGDEVGGVPYSAFEDESRRVNDPRNLSDNKDWFYLIGVGGSWLFGDWGDPNPIKRNRKKVPYTR